MTTTDSYREFIGGKSQQTNRYGFDPIELPKGMFPFQQHLATWALQRGRAAIFAECGLGKSIMQLAWADNVARKSNRSVLVLTPLAVGPQTVQEAAKFGIDAVQSRDGKWNRSKKIVVTNYERLHYFDPEDFAGVVCDESSCLKNFDGVRKGEITEFMRTRPYRLLCSATPAPNDFIEIGTSSECLGELGYMDMLSKFFKNDQNSNHPNRLWAGEGKWRFRGHAERDFWRWMCSWARAIRKPSDLGFPDDDFRLPGLELAEHVVDSAWLRPGELFPRPAANEMELKEERKRTLTARCERAASLVADTGKPAIVWCHLNAEGDRLERLIKDAVQVSGADSDERKEEVFTAFVKGEVRVLVTKPLLAGLGMNFQHCAHQTFFPSHSYEMYHQCKARSHRFGQKSVVTIDVVTSEGETGVMANLKRKAANADLMFDRLVAAMGHELTVDRKAHKHTRKEVPTWLLN